MSSRSPTLGSSCRPRARRARPRSGARRPGTPPVRPCRSSAAPRLGALRSARAHGLARLRSRRTAAHPLTDGCGALWCVFAGSAQVVAAARGHGGDARARRVDLMRERRFFDAIESARRDRCGGGARAAPGGRPAAPAPGALGRSAEPSGRSWEAAPAANGRFCRHDGLYGCVGRGSHVLRCIQW